MNIPRVMFAAPASGSGKTLITCGILQALVNRKMKVSSFKCGPDFIDPKFHERVIGTTSGNIDLFLAGTETSKYLFGRTAEHSDISVVEGVMGFYDGIGNTIDASSYDVSSKLNIPVVLVVDGRGSSTSAAATAKGFLEFRKNNIKGVIINNTNEKVYQGLKPIIEKELGLKAIGYVPKVKELVIESRHLGLIMPHEIDALKEKLMKLAETLERTLDIDEIVHIASSAGEFSYKAPKFPKKVKVRIGVAKDDCFCFIYNNNIELLERLGAEIVYFSPLHDKQIPKDIGGLIIPGGYPELFADALSRNKKMLADIERSVQNGIPCMAESGGFMYLHKELEDAAGKYHKMAGVIDGRAFRTEKLSKFGYHTYTAMNDGLMPEGTVIRGHEFHYWDSTACGNDCDAVRPSGGQHRCMHNTENIFAGFPHMYYYSNPNSLYQFLKRSAAYLG